MLKFLKKPLILTFTLFIAVLLFSACEDDNGPGGDNLNIAETVETESNLSTLDDLLSEYGLADRLSQEDPLTLFAPTDEALSKEDLDGLTDEEITDLLEYHIVSTNLTFENLQDANSAESLNGDSLFFSFEDDIVFINENQDEITSEGIETTNGIIFKVDTLLKAPQNKE